MHSKALLIGAASALLLLTILAPAPARAQPGSSYPFTVTEQIQPVYDVYGSTVNPVTVNITAGSSNLSSGNFTVTTYFPATVVSYVGVTPSSGSFNGSNGVYTDTFALVAGAASFSLSLGGNLQGATFLYRYIGGIPYVSIPNLDIAPQYLVNVPSGSILSQVYTDGGGSLPLSYALQVSSGAAGTTYLISSPVLLIFQPTTFLPASIAITVASLALLGLVALDFFPTGKRFYDDISTRLKSGLRGIYGALPFLGRRKEFKFRNLFETRKLLALFILCALLMVALGAVGGPDPKTKAYVIASQQGTTQVKDQLSKVAPNLLVLTPTQDFADFNVMSSVGQFNVVVISGTATDIPEVSGFVFPYLGNVPVIVIDDGVNSTVTTELESLYPNQILRVQNAGNLTSQEMTSLGFALSSNQRSNILGIHLGDTEFEALLGLEGILSMVLVFFGWAYLGSLASDSKSRRDLSQLVLLIAAGVFIFFFSESIYIATSSTLAVPLSLHAVNSDAHDLTAIGLLGFGGGSTPRLAAGFLGILVGAIGVEGGLRVSKRDFALIIGVAVFLAANPLYIGQYIYEGILLFFPLGSLVFGEAYANSLVVKGFIYGFGEALGGGVTPTYVLSAGNILFFAGLVPLAYLKRMSRTTTAFALVVVALMIGDGGVRVGQMTTEQTAIAIVPGLVAGFAFAVVLLAIDLVEKFVRGNWKSQG